MRTNTYLSVVIYQILETIHEVLLGNETNEIDEDLCDEMVSKNGYSALSCILRKLPNQCLTPKLVKFLGEIYGKMDTHSLLRPLQNSLFADLLTDFYVWTRAPFETQEELLSLLYAIHYERKREINTRRILSIIRMFYWIGVRKKEKPAKAHTKKTELDFFNDEDALNILEYLGEEDDMDDFDEKDEMGSGTSGSARDKKNAEDDEEEVEEEDEDYKSVHVCSDVPIRADESSIEKVGKLRNALFDIVKVKMVQSIEQEDVAAIVRYAFWTGCVSRKKMTASLENEHGDIMEILGVIDDALDQNNSPFAKLFVDLDGVEALLRLFTLESEAVRTRTIGVLGRLCHVQFSDEPGRKRVCEIAESFLSVLKTEPVTLAVYNALLKMAIADFVSTTVEITHMTNLVFPEVLCICLFPLLTRAPQSIRLRAYDDLEMILVKRTNAQSLLSRVDHWQYHLCKLLDGERANFIEWMRTRKEDGDPIESEETARIIELFGKILNNTVFESIMLCSDWSEVDSLLSLLRTYDAMPVTRTTSPFPPNNYFHLCRLSFFKAFVGKIATVINGEAPVEYRDVAGPSAPQFPLLVSVCVHIFDSLLLVSPGVARPYIYLEKQQLNDEQQDQQQQQQQAQKQLPRFSPKRVTMRFSSNVQVEKPINPAPRFGTGNTGDTVDPNSSPSDPHFELFILSNILAYADYLKMCTLGDWNGAEKVKSVGPFLQAHQGGFVALCTIAAARVLQLHALVGSKDGRRRCKAAIALLQAVSESLAPQEDGGAAAAGFYWILETTIHSFCLANERKNTLIAEEIFKLIFVLVRYIAQFKKLEKFISMDGASAVSSLAMITETSPAIYAYKKIISPEWMPAAKEIHIRAQPWVQDVLGDYKRVLIQAKKSCDSALERVFTSVKQFCVIDSFAACAKVYSSEVSNLKQYLDVISEKQQTNSVNKAAPFIFL